MTVGEMIEKLKELPPDMPVLRLHVHNGKEDHWTPMDGWSPNVVEVARVKNLISENGGYYPPGRHSKDMIDALEF